MGAVNLYSPLLHHFTEDAARLVEVSAGQGSILLAVVLHQAREAELSKQLQE